MAKTVQLNLFSNIELNNLTIDRSLTTLRLGRNGILYEYELPYGANPLRYYKEAVNVKSIKRSEENKNGYRKGQYQPVGDKRYFNYYQIQKMKDRGDWDKFIDAIIRRRQWEMLDKVERKIVEIFGE